MCGIVGVVGVGGQEIADRLRTATACMVTRGPDAEGYWGEAGANFGHRRLAILDLSPRSNQPLVSPDGRFVLTYNGEVYNFGEVAGGVPQDSDTLALLGPGTPAATPQRLRGMYAYALWDRQLERLTLVRDRFGMKPLYYSMDGTSLAFASTTRALAAVRGRRLVSTNALASYLRWGSVQGPATAYANVRELEPGTCLTWTADSVASRRYWDFLEGRSPAGQASLTEALSTAVRLHGISDVPVALFLSGGLDSAIVGALAAKVGLDITAFTLAFPGLALDESEEARVTARSLGLKHEVVEFGESEPDFAGYFDAVDQPSIDGLNIYLVAQAASQAGFRVALSGIGADELFAGYSTFLRVPAFAAANAVVPARLIKRLHGRLPGNVAKLDGLLEAGSSFQRLHEEFRSVFSRGEVERLLGVPAPTAADPIPSSLRLADVVTWLEVQTYLRHTLLRDADVFAMAHSLELRTPFVDHEVLAAALSISNVRRLAQRKRILADALGIDRLRQLARQPKRGFTLPIGQWLRTSLRERVATLLDGPLMTLCDRAEVARTHAEWAGGRGSDSKMWSLVVLDAWLRQRADDRY